MTEYQKEIVFVGMLLAFLYAFFFCAEIAPTGKKAVQGMSVMLEKVLDAY